jgi:hypothetical protein
MFSTLYISIFVHPISLIFRGIPYFISLKALKILFVHINRGKKLPEDSTAQMIRYTASKPQERKRNINDVSAS